MQVYSTIQLGESHPVYCEDALYYEEIADGYWVGAVMDGCTMGKESHFASTLIGKLLKKLVQDLRYQEFMGLIPSFTQQSIDQIGKNLIRNLSSNLRKTQNDLYLDTLEMLSTVVLTLIDSTNSIAWVAISGDGYILAKGQIIEVDQDNRPDYLAYHLSQEFNQWYEASVRTFTFEDILEIAIATDGIASFEKLIPNRPDFIGDPIKYLMLDDEKRKRRGLFQKKMAHLKNQHGLIPLDDVAVLQFVWDNH